MPLHTIYRPKTLFDVIGNESTISSLQSVLARDRDKPHTFLFTGPGGCGKTTMARILKNELECSNSDFYVYNTANTRGVDTVREITENCQFAPMNGQVKLFSIEECHQLTGPAQESLLMLIEEPPEHVYFVFCTTEPEKLKKTLKRRCHTYEMRPLDEIQLNQLIDRVLKQEGISAFPEAVIEKIVLACDGSPGKALNLLDTVIDIADDTQALKAIENVVVSESSISDVARVLISGKGKWVNFSKMVDSLTGEPENIRRALLGYLGKVLSNSFGQKADKVAAIMMELVEPVFNTGMPGLKLELYLALKSSYN